MRTRLRGKQIRLTYPGAATAKNLSTARQWAHDAIDQCKRGVDPREAERAAAAAAAADKSDRLLFEKVVDDFVIRYAKKHQRTWAETERIFTKYVTPSWRGRSILDIRRSDVVTLLDKIEDDNGPVMADRVLAAIRKLMNWQAARLDDWTPPIIKGMARTRPKERARSRVLSDDEIRALWAVTEGTFGAMVKILLVTAQRRDEVRRMTRSEIGKDGVWTIPAERYKTGAANVVSLPCQARELVAAQPIIKVDDKDSDLVFTRNGETPLGAIGKAKAGLDAAMLAKLREWAAERGDDPEGVNLPGWVLHDLRRTAKTLMMRAGVRPDISERALGHVIKGVEGTYDRHAYIDEKRDALDRLARLLREIIDGEAAKVVRLPARGAAE